MMNILYKFFFAIIILCTWNSSLLAQNSGRLTGTLQDENGGPVSFANVAVLKSGDSSLVTGAVTDVSGVFTIKTPSPGKYFLRMSAIGFANYETPPFEVGSHDYTHDFGPVTLQENVQQLNEVTVQSLRPTIINKIDRMVVSVEGTALAAGSSAYDILAKSPGVWIDHEGNIQLNGKSGVKIMINERPTYLSEKELQNMLEGMSAENIKNIEIITNPSAKYEAEGAAGIINITLKKNQLPGISGSVHGGYEYQDGHGYSGGGNLNYKNGKWASYINMDMARRTRLRTAHMERVFNKPSGSTHFAQEGTEDHLRYTPSVRIGTDYSLGENHSIGVMANLSWHEADQDWNTTSYLTNGDPNSNLLIDAQNYYGNESGTGTFNFHYLGKFDSAGTTLSADLDYVRLTQDGTSEFTNRFYRLETSELVKESLLTSDNPTSYDIYSAKIDLVKPVSGKEKLELGLKASYVQSDNKLNFFTIQEGQKIPDPTRTNHFTYEEYIYAAYANFSTQLSATWHLQAGLRAEQTIAEGHSLTLDQETPNNYLDLFPSVFVQQKISDNYQIGYNYSRRIERPRYGNLNPFIFYLDPYTWAQGNPYLRPEYTHSFEVKQTYKNSSLIVGYSLTKDFIAEVPIQNTADNTTVFAQRNVDDFKNLSATLVTPLQITPVWGMNNNIILAYQDYTTVLDENPIDNEQFFFMAQSTNNFQLPGEIKLEVNAGYQGPMAWGLYTIASQWWVDAGLKRSFMNDKLDLSLNVTDIFRSKKTVGSANVDGNVNAFDQYFGVQSFKINLRYTFSSGTKFELEQRKTNLEELDRAGGS